MPARIKIATSLIFILLVSGCTADTDILDSPRKVGLPVEVTAAEKPGLDKAEEDKAWGRDQEETEDPAPTIEESAGLSTSSKVDVTPEPKTAQTTEPSEPTQKDPDPVEATQPTLAEIAYADASKNADGSAQVSEDVVVMSPELPDFNKIGLASVTSDAMSFFDHDYGISPEYKIIAFSEKELDWANQKLAEYGGMLPPGYDSWQAWVASNPYMKADECWMSVNSFGKTHFCMATKESLARQQINTIAHEYVHNVQIQQLGLDTTKTPSWITEGGAEYLGFVIVNKGSSYSLNNLARWQTQYLHETYGGFGYGDYIFQMSEQDFVNAMKAISLTSVDPLAEQGNKRYGMYPLGAVANEYLIGKYSYDTYMSYIMDIGKGGQNWSTAFQNVFKMTPTQFYSELYDYIREAYS